MLSGTSAAPKLIDLSDRLANIKNKICRGEIQTLGALLFMLKIDGHIMSLDEHFQFEPVFKLRRSPKMLLMCARQLGKTYSEGARIVISNTTKRGYRILIVLPRFEQVKRMSVDVVKPYILTSPFRNMMVDSACEDSVLRRTFMNESLHYFSYAFLDTEKVRGISGIDETYIDEAQDVQWDFIPVIEECMSAGKKYGFRNYSGTPKTTDNTLSLLWSNSSQAEWHCKCHRCNRENIPDLENHLLKMIGKETVICYHCGGDLREDIARGHFVHHIPDKIGEMEAFHVSQVIHPLHYNLPHKWRDLRNKMKSWAKYRFYNEILGVPCDSNQKLISLSELKSACSTWNNDLEIAAAARNEYAISAVGIDWGGGGEETASFTSLVFGGVRYGSDVVEVRFMIKLSQDLNEFSEMAIITELFRRFQPQLIAHDYGGSGALRESLLLQDGVPLEQFVPFTYVCSANKPVISYEEPKQGYRSSFSLDKTRSLAVMYAMIKAGKIKFPTWETCEEMDADGIKTTLCMDLMHLGLERHELMTRSDQMLVVKAPKKSDDTAHAVNYLCSAIWRAMGRYPNLAEAERLRATTEAVAALTGGPEGDRAFEELREQAKEDLTRVKTRRRG
jgi:hypothetical protein